jgi:endonuclease/exonuclease/phosphatase family metal-dependent hydrolase
VVLALAALAAVFAADLRVMSFNVRYPNPGDGADRWEARRDLLVATIRDARPDLIGTQELFKEQGDYIVEKLPEYAWFGRSRRGNSENEHMGVFYRKETVQLLDSGDFWLSETPDTPASMSWGVTLPRMVTWGMFEHAAAKRRLYFLNTHFAHRREDEDARTRSARVIVERIGKLRGDLPLVLAGDYTAALDSEAYRALAAILKDARAGLRDPAGDIGTFHGFRGQPGAARIDWILYRGDLRPSRFETITSNAGGRYPSDHFPLVAEFEIPPR